MKSNTTIKFSLADNLCWIFHRVDFGEKRRHRSVFVGLFFDFWRDADRHEMRLFMDDD